MTPYNTKTDINFNSLIDWDRFPQFYFMFHQKSVFVPRALGSVTLTVIWTFTYQGDSKCFHN